MHQVRDPDAGETRASTAVVLLAAGAGSRFVDIGHKLLARLPNPPDSDTRATTGAASETTSTVFEAALRSAHAAAVGPVIVVTGALRRIDLPPSLPPDVLFEHNPDWATGQASSVHTGIRAAARLGASAVVVGLADQPFIVPDAWDKVARGLGSVRVATYDGRRSNPVRLHTDVWDLLPTSGDEGARVLMRTRPDLVVEVPCPGSPADIDTMEDLHRWQSN